MAVDSKGEINSGKSRFRVDLNDADDVSIASLPCSNICKDVFRHVQQLGETAIDDYRGYIGADLLHKPWRGQMQSRAEYIARSAKQLNSGKQLEDSTHSSILQSEIMARLSVEVECKKCRAKFWHAERSTLPDRPSNKQATVLKNQQAQREPCTCNISGSGEEDGERGIRLIFSNKTEEESGDENEPHSQPSDTGKLMRHIYNLQIPNKRLLEIRSWQWESMLSFLVVISEPEREDSDTKRNKITDETAIKAAQMLLAQEMLRLAAGETTEWEAGPLAWAVSHQRNHWSVSAFYLECNDANEYCLHTLPLWNGDVHSPSHALQLLLIVDYIVDWAREIFCGAITNSITKVLQIKPKPMFSQTHTSERFNKASHDSSGAKKDPRTLKDPFRDYDSQYGVIRDARYVRSLFVALYVTEDNFGTLMGSLSADERKALAYSILKCLSEAWRVTREGLDDLERRWTNKSRKGTDQYPKDKVFLTVITVTAYLTPSWEPTRELGYLAIAESLFDRLLEIAGLQRHPGRSLAGFPMVDNGAAIMFGLLKDCTAQDTLKACAARICRRSGIEAIVCGLPEEKKPDNWQIIVSDMTSEGMRHRLDVVIKPVPISKARNTVFDLFMRQMIELSSSLFRISSLLEELARPGEPKEYPEPPTGDECLWGFPPGLPDFEEKNVVLATTADPRKAGGGRDELCVFIMDPTVLETGMRLEKLLETHPDWHLRVKRFHRKHGWGTRDGNLTNFICRDQSMVPRLTEYCKHLEGNVRQGQPPGCANSLGKEEFWVGKEYTSGVAVFTKEGINFGFMDALSSVGAMRRGRRISSMVWRNPPKNADTAVRVSITVDSNGNPIRPSNPGSTTTREQGRAFNTTASGLLPGIIVTDTSPVDETEEGLSLLEADQDSDQASRLASDSGEPETGPSKGKRPLWDGLPEHEALGSPSKRSRPSISQDYGDDALTDAEFESFMQAGVFA